MGTELSKGFPLEHVSSTSCLIISVSETYWYLGTMVVHGHAVVKKIQLYASCEASEATALC
jgi:hypothetical protein